MKKFSLVLLSFTLLASVMVLAQPDVLSPDEHYQKMQEHHKEVFDYIVNAVPSDARSTAEALQTRRQSLDAALEALHIKAVEVKQQAIEQGEPKNVAKALAKQATADEQVELSRESAAFKEDMHAFLEDYPEVAEAVMGMHEKYMQKAGHGDSMSDMHAGMSGKGHDKDGQHQGMQGDKGAHKGKYDHQGMMQSGREMHEGKYDHQGMMQGQAQHQGMMQSGQHQGNPQHQGMMQGNQSISQTPTQRELVQGMNKLNSQQIQAILEGSTGHLKTASEEITRSWASEGNLSIKTQEGQLSGKWSVNGESVYCEVWLNPNGSRSNSCYHVYGKVGQVALISASNFGENKIITLVQ